MLYPGYLEFLAQFEKIGKNFKISHVCVPLIVTLIIFCKKTFPKATLLHCTKNPI